MNPFEGSLGIFDSGVGGLTVVSAILRRNPRERVLYVADQATLRSVVWSLGLIAVLWLFVLGV